MGSKKIDLVPFLSCGGIFLIGTCKADKKTISLLNVYGPCTDQKLFWEKVEGIVSRDLIVARDLNFIVSVGEVWGDSTLLDPITAFFKDIFLKISLLTFFQLMWFLRGAMVELVRMKSLRDLTGFMS
jgi:hypothetical protein